jgi:hypothetical protein
MQPGRRPEGDETRGTLYVDSRIPLRFIRATDLFSICATLNRGKTQKSSYFVATTGMRVYGRFCRRSPRPSTPISSSVR